MSTAAAMTQLNVRMEKSLRSSGNTALEEAGISPSEAVRALWRKVSHRGDDLRQVCEMLELTDAPSDAAEECRRKAELARKGQALFAEGCVELGISQQQAETITASWRDVREAMIAQRLGERGML